MNPRRAVGAVCLLALAATSGIAHAQSAIQQQIESLNPDFYWALENSFRSDIPGGANALVLGAYEKGGASLTGTVVNDPTTYTAADYFPMLPDHRTDADGSNALIFGETEFDLAGARRYLTLTEGDLGDDALDALNMSAKNPWTLHMIVSPDEDPDDTTSADDPGDDRGPETVFFVGHEITDVGMGIDPTYIKVQADRRDDHTVFTLTRAGRGFADTTSVTINDSAGRKWYQVTIKFYNAFSFEMRVNGTASPTVNTYVYLYYDENGEMYIGADNPTMNAPENEFNGAVHHVAIWKAALDDSTDIAGLEQAYGCVYSPVRTTNQIDWDADPRFYTWSTPTLDDADEDLDVTGNRDLNNWTDPIWDEPWIFPIVRAYTESPNTVNNTPDGYTPATDKGVASLAKNAADWTNYVHDEIIDHARDQVGTKSLSDGFSMMLFAWGASINGADVYQDRGGARALLVNWRDSRKELRAIAATGNGELGVPIYREGISQNAFRSREVFRMLRDELDTRSLPLPSRLHMDNEHKPTAAFQSGWDWDYTVASDPRAGDGGFWQTENDTFSDINPQPNTSLHQSNPANALWRIEYKSFLYRQSDFAHYHALTVPAFQELNPQIRVSNYGEHSSGSSAAETVYDDWVIVPRTNTRVNYLDFNCGVYYDVSYRVYHYDDSGRRLNDWESALGIDHILRLDDEPTQGQPGYRTSWGPENNKVTENMSNLYVERSKHNINAWYVNSGGAMGKPGAIWIAVPGAEFKTPYRNLLGFEDDGSGGDDHTKPIFETNGTDANGNPIYVNQTITRGWQDIARITAFAHRRGTREFLIFDPFASYLNPTTAEKATETAMLQDLEKLMNCIQHVIDNPADVTTTGALTRSDPDFGVPDGCVNGDDLTYYMDRWADGDLEADWSGDNGHPDGTISAADQLDYLSDYAAGTCP